MKQKKILPIILCLLSFKGLTQPFTPNGLEHLNALIHTFMNAHDTRTEMRKSEYILLFLKVDSSGTIKNVNIMSDEKNGDSTYAAIKSITPEDLNKWTSKEYRNKVIIIPITSKGYLDPATNGYLFQGIYDPIFIPKECKTPKKEQNYTLGPELFYLWPASNKSQH